MRNMWREFGLKLAPSAKKTQETERAREREGQTQRHRENDAVREGNNICSYME